MLKNVQIHFADRVPEPTLYEVIEKLALLKPHLVFVHDKEMMHWTNARPFQRPFAPNVDTSKAFACKFRVMDNGITAGYLNIGHYYSRRSGAKDWRIGVTSHLINNTKGSRNTAFTSDVNKALANAKKYLSAKSIGRILYEQYVEAQSVAGSVISKLWAPVTRGHFLTSSADAQALLHAYMTGTVSHVANVASAMRAKLLTPEFEKALSEYYLAKFFSDLVNNRSTVYIHKMDHSYVFFTDTIPNNEDEADKASVTVMEFEQLPIATQDKLGVLQLMQDRELIKDVGLRVSEDSFILM